MYVSGKQCKIFMDAIVNALVNSLGASEDDRAAIANGETFQFMSDAGLIKGHVCKANQISPRKWSVGWVHFRIQDLDKAKTVLPHAYDDRLNGYSGKWNFMFNGASRAETSCLTVELDDINPSEFKVVGGYTIS